MGRVFLDLYHGRPSEAVFDIGAARTQTNPQRALGFDVKGTGSGLIYRVRDIDRRKPSRVVTAQLMGDPPPHRAARAPRP